MDRCARTRVFRNPEGGEDITALCTRRTRHGWNHEDGDQGLSWDADGELEVPEALRSHVRDPHFRLNVLARTTREACGTSPEEILEELAPCYPDATVEDVVTSLEVWWATRRQVSYVLDMDAETRRYTRLY